MSWSNVISICFGHCKFRIIKLNYWVVPAMFLRIIQLVRTQKFSINWRSYNLSMCAYNVRISGGQKCLFYEKLCVRNTRIIFKAKIRYSRQTKYFRIATSFHCVKCPNTELFLVRILPYSDWIRTRNNSVFGQFPRSVQGYIFTSTRFSLDAAWTFWGNIRNRQF